MLSVYHTLVLFLWIVCGHSLIPIVNISQLKHPNSNSHDIISLIKDSLNLYGLVILRNHGISLQLLQSVRNIMINDIFSLSISEKLDVSMKEAYGRGYIGVGRESGLSTIYEPKEGYSYGYDWSNNNIVRDNSLQQYNIWPRRLSNSSISLLDRYFQSVVNISEILKDILLSDLHVSDAIEEGGDKISILRVFHYFQNDSDSCIASSPHTDWGFLTVISHDGVDGLQFYHNNTWHDVKVSEEDLVINAGDYLSYISKGKYRSPVHRVLCPNHSNRLSFVLFYYPGYNSKFRVVDERIETHVNVDGMDDISYATLNFNSMFDGRIESKFDSDLCFGDYIMEKWKGVQR